MKRDFVGRVISRNCAEGDDLCRAVIQADPSGKGEDAQALIRHFKLIEVSTMAKSSKPRPPSTKPGTKSSKGGFPSKDGKTGTSRTSSNRGKSSKAKTMMTTDAIPGDVSVTTKRSENLSAVRSFVSDAEVSIDASTTFNTGYPNVVNLITYSALFTPAGSDTSSLVGQEFASVHGRRILQDILKSLKRTPAVALTTTHIADYFNTVSQALFVYYSTAHHIRTCYLNDRRKDLKARFDMVYDESIAPSHSKLGKALFSYYLPSHIIKMIDFLSRVYLSDNSRATTYLQITPHAVMNSPANYVTLLDGLVTSLNGLTNGDTINTALSSEFYDKVSKVKVQQTVVPLPDTRSSYFFDMGADPVYSDDFLNIWANLPIEAGDGAATVREAIATTDATITRAVFGNEFTIPSNALPCKFLTSSGLHEPGFMQPVRVSPTAATHNNFRVIIGNGTESEVDIATTGIVTVVFGTMARNTENVMNTASFVTPMIPSGAYFVQTNFNRLQNDASKMLEMFFKGVLTA